MISTQVLWICSRPAPVSGFKHLASQQGFSYQCEIAITLAEAQEKLVFQDFDSVVLYLDKAAFFIDGFLTECLARSIPMIVIMPQGKEDTILQFLQKGVADFLVEDLEGNYLKLLPLSLSRVTQALMTEKLIASIDKRPVSIFKESVIKEPIIQQSSLQELIIQEPGIQENIPQETVAKKSYIPKNIHQESIVKELITQPLSEGSEIHQKTVEKATVEKATGEETTGEKTACDRQDDQLSQYELARQIKQQQLFWRSLIDVLPNKMLAKNCKDQYLLANQVSIAPFSDNDFLAIIQDIADHQNAKSTLQRNQETTYALIQAIPDRKSVV